MITKEKAIDILDKIDFFQGQRAGRELWNEKPRYVQEIDLKAFQEDVESLREYIADVVPKSEVAREIFEEIEEIFNKRIAFYTDMAKQSKFTEKHYAETMIKNCEIYLEEIAELKKKYTEDDT